MASLSSPQSEKASIEAFKRDVIDASATALVLVDFWAEWCGPCKTLTPLLERIVAAHAPRVKLVKIDIDKNPAISAQFRIQSIPTVYAFLRGQPVDGFQGALSEREINTFVDRLLAAVPPAPGDPEVEIKEMIAAANEALDEGEAAEAAEMFSVLAQEFPDRVEIIAGYARALVALGQHEAADTALAALAPDAKDPTLAQTRAAIALAKDAVPVDDLAGLAARVAADPGDHAGAVELAGGLMARGDRDGAADVLLASIAGDRDANEGAAKARLLKMLEAAGFTDPWAAAVRRRLSTILFA
ncbi:tetratricopeptide repeat protein [Glacieibacterium megasporae]|uniref:tetratricopeptide repeat protein n=1 Tax=Glacieibacterium megasporae TaxID=2835787 RepID=UPI001C1E0A2F|nr:tetratricopeptide repeat protein [Polymorphobacter megasporae]UAJ10886.1 tetratricopeptide repeat protein [Polymorphobacter megasporae]